MLFFFFFTKSEEMSRVGSRDRHPRWRSKIHKIYVFEHFSDNYLYDILDDLEMFVLVLGFQYWAV